MNDNDSLIDNSIVIDFDLPPGIQDIVNVLEKADIEKNYGIYTNWSDAIEYNTKDYVNSNILTANQRNLLIKKYCIRWWAK